MSASYGVAERKVRPPVRPGRIEPLRQRAVGGAEQLHIARPPREAVGVREEQALGMRLVQAQALQDSRVGETLRVVPDVRVGIERLAQLERPPLDELDLDQGEIAARQLSEQRESGVVPAVTS